MGLMESQFAKSSKDAKKQYYSAWGFGILAFAYGSWAFYSGSDAGVPLMVAGAFSVAFAYSMRVEHRLLAVVESLRVELQRKPQ